MPWEQTRTQRFLTVDFITKRRLNAPAVWLKPLSAVPSAEDAIRPPEGLDTALTDWDAETDDRNLAIRLVDGYVELRIQSPDDVWATCLFKAFHSLQVDARAAYGSAQVSSIIFKTAGDIDPWRDRWPRGHVDKAGKWVETKFFYSAMPTPRSKAIWVDSRPLPGSIFGNQLVVWRPLGKPAARTPELGLEDLEPRHLAATSMESICRAIAFATLGYWIEVYLDGLQDWDESLTRTIGGWIARLVREGQDINARGRSLEQVCWSPIDSSATASELLNFLGRLGAKRELGVSFLHAEGALERNSAAPVPGWGAIETLFGAQAKVGIRRAFRAGLDIDDIERMSELYVYDRTSHEFIDRDELLKGLSFTHKHDGLIERHKPEKVFVGKKAHNPFELYAGSSLRTDVQHQDFYPAHEPGGVLRFSPVHGLLNGEDKHPDEFLILNTFPGFIIKPIATIDLTIMSRVVSLLDRMLGLLTRDNDAQIKWLKQWKAWIVQHPDIKQQVAPVMIGGQGIGKSRYGRDLMRAIFGEMAGKANMNTLGDDRFLVTPFRGKLVTFIDEVRLESIASINVIKNLIREDYISGQLKFQHQRDYYIPSRVILASNVAEIGLTPEDSADRALFFIVSWTAQNMKMTDNEFINWSNTHKPFYNEFLAALKSVVFRQHLMRYLLDFEVTREELEDLTHSSRNDETVVRSTMSKAREVARAIVADARIIQGSDITAWFNISHVRDAIKRIDGARSKVEASQVMIEFERAGVIEPMRGYHRFKYGYGKLLQKMGEAHGLPIVANWDYKPGDFDDNDVQGAYPSPPWRGNRQQKRDNGRGGFYDPDAMGPE